MTSKKLPYSLLSIPAIIALIAMAPTMNSIDAQPAENRNYLAEANVKFAEIQKLDAEIETINAKGELSFSDERQMDHKQSQINDLFEEISELEKLNKKLYEIEPEKEAKLRLVEHIIYDKYYSVTPEDTNLIVTLGANLRANAVDVFIDESKMLEQGQTKQDVEKLLNQVVNDDEVKLILSFITPQDISCSSKTADCDPLISGISVEEDGANPATENTMGYKATKGSDSGFVMAAHSANDDSDADIVQAHDSTRVVGNIDAIDTNNCDCAFAHADQSISVDAEIWKNSSTNYDIVGKTDDADQDEGTWVNKVGVGTGISLGEITNNSSVTGFGTVVEIYHGTGDSGSSVFTLSSDDATIYGMLVSSVNSTHAVFQPHDYIEDQLSITTSTS